MDFAKLIERRDKLIAEATATLEGHSADAATIPDPIELQTEQADRVRERIQSLETSKAELLSGVDAELKALKSELEARERKIDADRENLEAAAKAAAAQPGADGKEGGRAPAAKRVKARAAAKVEKAPRAASGKAPKSG